MQVVQKALEHVLVDQRKKIVSELEDHVLECVKSNNANHVIQVSCSPLAGLPSPLTTPQRIITLNPPQNVVDAFVGNVEELCLHPYGCRVLQKAFECLPDSVKRRLLDEMHRSTSKLIEDQFGSGYMFRRAMGLADHVYVDYVVQSVVICCEQKDKHKVIEKIKGKVVTRASMSCSHRLGVDPG